MRLSSRRIQTAVELVLRDVPKRWITHGVCVVSVLLACTTVEPTTLGSHSATPSVSPQGTFASLRWQSLAPLPVGRSHLSAVALDQAVYAIGGLERNLTNGTIAFDRYDPLANTWTGMPALPSPTDHAASAVLDGAIYVFGGSFAQPTARSYRFDPSRRSWSPIAALFLPRAAGGAATVLGRIYVAGGLGADRAEIKSVDAYDPATDTWAHVSDLPTPREHLAVVSFRDMLCTLGGHFGNSSAPTDRVECYSPATGRWSTLPPLRHAASDFGAAVAGGSIWAVGDTVQAFDGTQWSDGPSLEVPRFGVAVASFGNSLYVVSGVPRRSAPDGLVDRLDIRP
jgi:N-acetylneuraminic acid mutarotase